MTVREDAEAPKALYFPDDGSEEWLDWIDAAVAVHLLQDHTARRPANLLEIGVWRGGWAATMLGNVPDARLVGVDPYPAAAAPVRREMLDRLGRLGVADRFVLHRALDEVDPEARFDLIHIDGDHSEDAVWRDLHFARTHLAPQGVIVVDDLSHRWLPGVASATYRFLEHTGLRMFMITPAKGYLAHAEHAARLHHVLRSSLPSIPSVKVAGSFEELAGHPYPEDSSILGQPLLLVRGRKKGAAEVAAIGGRMRMLRVLWAVRAAWLRGRA